MSPEFERTLENYADVLIRVGLNLQPGQRLFIQASFETVPLVRLLTKKAYQAGASYVDVLLNDEQLSLIRFQYAPRDSFDETAKWIMDALTAHCERGDALLSIAGGDPDLLKGQDQTLMATAQRAASKNRERYYQLVGENAMNWLVVAAPHPVWAAKVLPDVPAEQREAKLWDLIFEMSRVKGHDPVGAWQAHIRNIQSRADYLNNKRYTTLKYTAPGTDLTVGLPEGHHWEGAGSTSKRGIFFVPNIPTEEVFTLPHKDRVDGTVTATKPLSYLGTLVENFCLTFQGGKVVNVTADKGKEVLDTLLATDEGSSRLGEVALVPNSSPISQSKRIFYNTLFDENASCHVALGMAYKFTLQGGESMTPEAFAAAGGNNSRAHVDFMIGSDQLTIYGITADGKTEPIMRQGEWAY